LTDLETDRHQTKRRFTDYCFQRVRADVEVPLLPKEQPAKAIRESHRAASSHAASTQPVVRATSPGAGIRDEVKRRAAQKALRDRYLPKEDVSQPVEPELTDAQTQSTLLDKSFTKRLWPTASLRRFHLYHDSRRSHSTYPSGIQKRKTTRKKYLATFIEGSKLSRPGSDVLGKVEDRKPSSRSRRSTMNDSADGPVTGEDLRPALSCAPKTGQSMYDHPSTWDYDADQLAEELAAFALEISQSEKQNGQPSKTPKAERVDFDEKMVNDEDFIYETYIRVPIVAEETSHETRNDVGLLVVDEDDQELWQTFVESDDDSEWDEEDPDSNGWCC
jgi:Transcription factor Iwr1